MYLSITSTKYRGLTIFVTMTYRSSARWTLERYPTRIGYGGRGQSDVAYPGGGLYPEVHVDSKNICIFTSSLFGKAFNLVCSFPIF